MAPQAKAGPATEVLKMFKFRKQFYDLPDIDAIDMARLEPEDFMAKLKSTNPRLPNKTATIEFLSAAFFALLKSYRGKDYQRVKETVRGPWPTHDTRLILSQWKVRFYEYKLDPVRESSRTAIRQKARDRNKKNIIIDSQNWWLSTLYEGPILSFGLPGFARRFMSMNPTHPRQDFTPDVLLQAFDAYVTRYPNVSSDARKGMTQRVSFSLVLTVHFANLEQKNSKRARSFLKECGRFAAQTRARAEMAAADCSDTSSSSGADIEVEEEVVSSDGDNLSNSSSDSATENEGEMQDSKDGSEGESETGYDVAQDPEEDHDGDVQDNTHGIIPAADISADSTSTSTEEEGENNMDDSSSVDDEEHASSEGEIGAPDIIQESCAQASESTSDDSSYKGEYQMSIGEEPKDDKLISRKRPVHLPLVLATLHADLCQRVSTPPPSAQDVHTTHQTHPRKAKRIRVATTQARSPTPGCGSTNTGPYRAGRDLLSALEDYLDLCSNKYKAEAALLGWKDSVKI